MQLEAIFKDVSFSSLQRRNTSDQIPVKITIQKHLVNSLSIWNGFLICIAHHNDMNNNIFQHSMEKQFQNGNFFTKNDCDFCGWQANVFAHDS